MKRTWRTEVPQLALIAAMFVLAATSWSSSPDRIPVHWGPSMQADRYGGRLEGLLTLPLVALCVYGLTLVLPRFDPGRANYRNFPRAYNVMRVSITATIAALYGIVQASIRGYDVPLQRVMPVVVGVLLVVLGNLMGKIRPNFFVGIRTPWSLTSKASWTRTHRLGGWLFVACGIATLIAGISGLTQLLPVVLVGGTLATAVVVFAYSYVVWRSDPDRVPAAGTSPADDD